MPGFLSTCDLSPNAIEAAKDACIKRGRPLINLSDANPTSCGLALDWKPLADSFSDYLQSRTYEPNPRGLLSARRAIAAYYHERDSACTITPEQIFITASTSESYRLLFSLLCDAGDNCLAPHVSYPLFDQLAEASGIELRPYDLALHSGRWSIDQNLTCAKDEHSRAILVVSPHNPTGHTVSAQIPALHKLNLPVICDEVFADYAEPRPPILASLHPDLPVFSLNGISKMFGLPDFKLGWIVLNQPAYEQYAERLEFLNDLFLSASYPIQRLLPRVFELGRTHRITLNKFVQSNIERVCAQLTGASWCEIDKPEGGIYLFPKLNTNADPNHFVIELIEHGVYVQPGYYFGWEDDFRIALSCMINPHDLEAGLKVIAHVCR